MNRQQRHYTIEPSRVRAEPEFVRLVMALWRQGKNTADIADIANEHETAVCVALRIGREKREAA